MLDHEGGIIGKFPAAKSAPSPSLAMMPAVITCVEPSDATLIGEILAGGHDRFALLIQRYHRAVHAAAWAIVRDHHAAEDVAQETFIKAYRQLATLRRPEMFTAWLLIIARRGATDAARAHKRLPDVAIADAPADPTTPTDAEESAAQLLDAIRRLPGHEQHVVMLRYFEDLPVAGIAARLGRPVGTITKQLSRALARLRTRLEEKR
jgi:RNA polymerase sigma-70 factor (ECF subfamily)